MSAEYTVKRFICGASSGCKGSVSLYSDDEPRVGRMAPLEEILGEPLGEGARIEISVRLITPGASLEKTYNPWHRPGERDCSCTAKTKPWSKR